MKLQIDIKTPSGKSLEGFPTIKEYDSKPLFLLFVFNCLLNRKSMDSTWIKNPVLSPDDTITITVLKEKE